MTHWTVLRSLLYFCLFWLWSHLVISLKWTLMKTVNPELFTALSAKLFCSIWFIVIYYSYNTVYLWETILRAYMNFHISVEIIDSIQVFVECLELGSFCIRLLHIHFTQTISFLTLKWSSRFSPTLGLFIFFFSFVFGFLLFCLFWLCPQHAEVSRSGIKPSPQQQSRLLQWQHWILNLPSHRRTSRIVWLLSVCYIEDTYFRGSNFCRWSS